MFCRKGCVSLTILYSAKNTYTSHQNVEKNGNKMVKQMDPVISYSSRIKLVSKWSQVGPMASVVPQFCAKSFALKLDGLLCIYTYRESPISADFWGKENTALYEIRTVLGLF